MLKSRSLEQILTISWNVDYLIHRYFSDLEYCAIDDLKIDLMNGRNEYGYPEDFEKFFEWDGGSVDNGRWIFKKKMAEQLDVLTAENSNIVDALKSLIEDWDDEAPEDDPNERKEGKNYEFFAVLALILVADSQKWTSEYRSTTLAGESAIQAMDAVCHAEHLQRKAGFKECLLRYKADEEKSNLKKIHSERGTKGAIKRHEPMRLLKQWAILEFKKGDWEKKKGSANKAACDLKDRVMAHGKTIEANLSPQNAQGTIASWISDYRTRLAAKTTR